MSDFQNDFAKLLRSIGVLEDPRPIGALVFEFAREHLAAFPDHAGHYLPFPKLANVANDINSAIIDHVVQGIPLPELVESLRGVSKLVRDVNVRHIWGSLPESKQWNGSLGLELLFESEQVVAPEGAYFDQRFIDYLAAQPLDLGRIHWRKFEQLTAEYFRRVGYVVKIGPGRDDGGVDVVAERKDEVVGPALIVLQCRRYGDTHPVGLDAVRAFWATIGDQSATRGLIATTSRLTEGARKYCDARRYRLSAAEGSNVREWLRAMSTQSNASEVGRCPVDS